MSGAEAALVLGLISSALSILEAAYQVYDAANDTKGLTKTFRTTADQIPLVLHTLELAQKGVSTQTISDDALKKALPVLENCKRDATTIKDVFDKVLPSENAPRSEKYKKAIELKLKSGTVKRSMQQVMENLTLLSQQRIFEDSDTLEDIKAGVAELTNVSDEETTSSVHHGSGNIINHSGTGNVEDHAYTNSGSGSIYKANSMVFVTKGATLGNRPGEERNSILRWISTLDYTAHHKGERSKLLPSTCEWLLNKTEYEQWCNAQHSAKLWLHGINGFGKTALMAKVIDSLMQRRERDVSVVVFFYCSSTSQERNQLSIDALLRCFLHQIITTSSSLEIAPEIWRLRQERENRGFGDRPLDLEECIELIVPLLATYGQAYFAVDGIDECESRLREGVLQAMDRITSASKIPVKFIVSGRDNHDLLARFRAWPEISLHSEDNADDIQQYISETIRERLSSGLLCSGDMSETNHLNMQTALRRKANGMFRWVSSSIEYVCANATLEGDIEEALNQLPPELTLMNDLIFQQIMLSLNHTRSIAMKTFIWLMTAKQELDASCFLSAIATPTTPLDDGLPQRQISADDVLRACRTLVVFDAELHSFRFSHASVKEYFQLSVPNPWLEVRVRHTILAKICLDLISHDAESPLFWYSRIWWAYHCSLSKKGRSKDGIIIDGTGTQLSIYKPFQSFLNDDYAGSETFRNYSKLMNSYFGDDWKYAARELLPDVVGIRSYGQETLQNFEKVFDMRWAEEKRGCSYFAVCVWGFRELLGAPDANTMNAYNHDGISCLGLAVRYGHEWHTERLISLGADVNAGKEFSPIHLAAMQGDVNFLDLAWKSTLSKLDLNRRTNLDGSTALMLAAENLHIAFVHSLVKLGANTTLRDFHGRTALHRLVSRADSSSALMMASTLLATKKLVNLVNTKDGLTALQMCIRLNKGFLLPRFLDSPDIDVNQVTKTGESTFDIAMSTEEPFAVKLLLAHPRLRPISDVRRRAYLYSAAMTGLPDLLNCLLERWCTDIAQIYPDPRCVTTLGPMALSYHHGPYVQSAAASEGVISYNGDVELPILSQSEPIAEKPAIVSAILCGNRAAIEICVAGETALKTPDAAGRSTLWWALSIGRKDIARQVISAEVADLNAQDETWRYSPLHLTVMQDQIDMGNLLLSKPCIHKNIRDSLGQTPLILACRLGRLNFVQSLLSRHGKETEPVQLEAIDHETGRTAFLWACYSGHVELAKLLCNHGASVKAVDWDRCCAISLAMLEHSACLAENDSALIKRYEATETWLIGHNGLDFKHRDSLGRSPIWLAAATNNVKCLTKILSTFATIDLCNPYAANLEGQNIVAAASILGHLGPIECLHQRGCSPSLFTAKDSRGQTPLALAAFHGHQNVVEYLLSKDASLALTEDNKLRNPIFLAVQSGNAELVSALLKIEPLSERAGALDLDGRSAFSIAVEFGHVRIARLLYEQDPPLLTVPDKENHLPLVHAAASGQVAAVNYLLTLKNHGCGLASQNNEDRPAQRVADSGFLELALVLANHDCVDGVEKLNWADIDCYVEREAAESYTNWRQIERFEIIESGRTVLSHACGLGNLSLVKSFFVHHRSGSSSTDLTLPDNDGHPPIWHAIHNGHKHIVWEFIANGALASDAWELVLQEQPQWIVEYKVAKKLFRTMDTTVRHFVVSRSPRFRESPVWQRPWTKAMTQKVEKLVRSFDEYRWSNVKRTEHFL